ncbi:MAG: sulfotransferase, partial [Halioglobus sp.]
LGNYEQAMQQLLAGKALKLEQLQPQQQDNKALFSALGQASTRLARLPVTGCDSPEPIFIVGMPRTGTTLVERILSSHSQVVSAGELANFSTLVKQQLGTASRWVLDVETIEQADKLDFEKLGRDYLESTRHLTGNSAHFIDKMPLNFMYIPLIAKALPRAKIICLRRNPMDTVLSNFRQLFATSFTYYNYAYSLKDSAEFYVAFDALIAQCEQDLGTRLYSIAYESVVADAEAQTRQLLQYCELPWEPQCLAFQENTAPVATASAVQVREKLYQRAVHRWKHYEPWLGAVKDIFNANHIVFE